MSKALQKLVLDDLAATQHEIWSSWMRWMFNPECGHFTENGEYVIKADKVKRWARQLATTYDELSEEEKESDKEVVREFFFKKKE